MYTNSVMKLSFMNSILVSEHYVNDVYVKVITKCCATFKVSLLTCFPVWKYITNTNTKNVSDALRRSDD